MRSRRAAAATTCGRQTSFHRGGGHKRRYRVIDFKRGKWDVPAKVATIEYDPNRSARIALLHYHDGEKRYILAPVGLNVNDHRPPDQRARRDQARQYAAHSPRFRSEP